jgi:hypothetical protein
MRRTAVCAGLSCHRHHLNLRSASSWTSFFRNLFATTPSEPSTSSSAPPPSPSPAPVLQPAVSEAIPAVSVGIFIDLDNMSFEDPTQVTRKQVTQKIRPLRTLSEEQLGATNLYMAAFANLHTQRYKKKTTELAQEYMGAVVHGRRPAAVVQTGYDETGILRCGVCGAKMTLTKKNRARGMTERDKLKKHMKRLHDREQQKRQTRANELMGKRKKAFLSKVGEKMQKYKSAQVGLNRGPTNDWFRILREESVHPFTCDNVDQTLMEHAKRWVNRTRRTNGVAAAGSRIYLVVVSEDSDFVPLLASCRNNKNNKHHDYCAISATWSSTAQTRALVSASDIVVTLSKTPGFAMDVVAATSKGSEILLLLDDDDDKDERAGDSSADEGRIRIVWNHATIL